MNGIKSPAASSLSIFLCTAFFATTAFTQEKADPFLPGVHRPREYEGHYRSEEPGASGTVQVLHGRLATRTAEQGDNELIPAAPDRFRSPQGRVDFFRGKGGWVAGFLLSDGRDRVV